MLRICGFGLDVVSIARITKVAAKSGGARFVRRVLHPLELAEYHRRQEAMAVATGPAPAYLFLAGRWAAKEALWKAGIRGEFRSMRIVTAHTTRHTPRLALCTEGNAEQCLADLGIQEQDVWLSISHENDVAVASVVLQAKDDSISDDRCRDTP